MAVNALYSANGRIRKVFVFDTKPYRLEEDGEAHPFAPVLAVYKNMAADLNALHPEAPVMLYVFFRIFPKGRQSEAYEDTEHRIYFVPVNTGGKPVSIPSRWTQDVLGIFKENQIYCNVGDMDQRLIEMLSSHSGGTVGAFPVSRSRLLAKFPQHCEDGNLLRGKNGDFEYIIKSWYTKGTCMEAFIKEFTGITKRNIMNVAKEDDDLTRTRALFHADMYATIVGNIGGLKELVLVAEPFQEKWPLLKKATKKLVQRLARMRPQDSLVRFVTARLPMIVINNRKGELIHTLSYNNCLVENYEENGTRRINFYFPDYSEIITEMQEKSDAMHVKFAMVVETGPLVAAAGMGPVAMAAIDPMEDKQVTAAFLETVRTKIHENLEAVLGGIAELEYRCIFVRHRFRNLAAKRGALHCMAKVIERDLIPE